MSPFLNIFNFLIYYFLLLAHKVPTDALKKSPPVHERFGKEANNPLGDRFGKERFGKEVENKETLEGRFGKDLPMVAAHYMTHKKDGIPMRYSHVNNEDQKRSVSSKLPYFRRSSLPYFRRAAVELPYFKKDTSSFKLPYFKKTSTLPYFRKELPYFRRAAAEELPYFKKGALEKLPYFKKEADELPYFRREAEELPYFKKDASEELPYFRREAVSYTHLTLPTIYSV